MRDIEAIVIHHTAGRHTSLTWAEIKKYHMEVRGFADIAYHYGVVNDFQPGVSGAWGWVTGRPVEMPGAHCKRFNATTIGVVFEGNYSIDLLPPDALETGVIWVASLMRRWQIPIDRVFPHNQVGTTKTECPGTKFPWREFIRQVDVQAATGV